VRAAQRPVSRRLRVRRSHLWVIKSTTEEQQFQHSSFGKAYSFGSWDKVEHWMFCDSADVPDLTL
jgi:hypothetical protein